MPEIEASRLEPETLSGNIENLIGSVEVPVGLAGPLLFRGTSVAGRVVAPLATTEGALIASISRGANAISRSGGVATRTLERTMNRAPAFYFPDVAQAARFADWVGTRLDDIRECVSLRSNHAKLVRLEPIQTGRVVHVRFCYHTGDAAGQNMTTSCTWAACRWLADAARREQLQITEFYVENNGSSDKKTSHLSSMGGRGARVVAECTIDADTLSRVLRVTPHQMTHFYQQHNLITLQAGTFGNSINANNLLTALYLATGQDVACVAESSGIFSLEATDSGLYASLVCTNLIVGTVGGGTGLPCQQEALRLLGCTGPGTAERLAEIIGGFALALDISTLAAIVSGEFADAHDLLGRNRVTRVFASPVMVS